MIIDELLILCLGIFLGWVVIPQPAWAQKLYDWIVMTTVKLWVKYVEKKDINEDPK